MPKNPNASYDWTKIKTEYITDENSSLRILANKYGVAAATICKRSKREGWVNERERYLNAIIAKQKKEIANSKIDRTSRLLTVSDKLLRRVERFLEDDSTNIPPSQLESIAKVLKNIRDIQNGDKDESSLQVNVVFGDGSEDFAQ